MRRPFVLVLELKLDIRIYTCRPNNTFIFIFEGIIVVGGLLMYAKISSRYRFFFRFVLRRYRVARRTYSRGLIEKGRGGGGRGKKTPRFPIRRFAKTGQYVLFVRISRRRLQNIFAIYGAASNNAGLIYGVARGINGDKANLRNIFNASRYTRVRLPLDFDSRSSFSRRCMHSDNYRGFFKSNVFYSRIVVSIFTIYRCCAR